MSTAGRALPRAAVVRRTPTPARSGGRSSVRRTTAGALLRKALVFVLGLALVLLGLVLVVAPGPLTIPPVLLGLYLWSTEFAWAERLLDRAKIAGQAALADARRRPVLTGVVTGGGLVALAVGVWLGVRHALLSRALEAVGL